MPVGGARGDLTFLVYSALGRRKSLPRMVQQLPYSNSALICSIVE